MHRFARDKIRDRCNELVSAARVIELLLWASTTTRREKWRRARRRISIAGKHELREMASSLECEVKEKFAKLGVPITVRQLARLLPRFERDLYGDTHSMVPKAVLDYLFPRVDRVVFDYADFPKHTMFFVEEPQTRPTSGFKVNWFILEVSLYEEMCALLNTAKRQEELARPKESSFEVYKTSRAMNHAAVTSAYYFAEAYANGLAFDIFACRQDTLTDKDKGLLTETDPESRKPRALSIREKFLQYPRIALSVAHPPFQESNCAELKFLTQTLKPMRDAIAHASPIWDTPFQWFSQKLDTVQKCNWKFVCESIDNVLALIIKVENATRKNKVILNALHTRDDSGGFPPIVFN